MRIQRIILIVLIFLISAKTQAQWKNYSYNREILGGSLTWNKIKLPDDIYAKVSPSLKDLRIYGITATKDTVEAPYILKTFTGMHQLKQVQCRLLNESYSSKGYFFTFEVASPDAISEIDLKIAQENFDWKVTVEGSQNQQDWFTIVEKYRILGLKNESTNFTFSKITFPLSKYKFLRICIPTNVKPEIKDATLAARQISSLEEKIWTAKTRKNSTQKNLKTSEIDLEFDFPVPINHLDISVLSSFEYYRPISISYVRDSIKTEKGWILQYENVLNKPLVSNQNEGFDFPMTIVKKMKITIFNEDNTPLEIGNILAKGHTNELLVRFTEKANYFLTYGNATASAPEYDVAHFNDQLPTIMPIVGLGKERKIAIEEKEKAKPLFENKTWLWIIMLVIIIVLAWFTIKMIVKK